MLPRHTPKGSPITTKESEGVSANRKTKTVLIAARKPSERFMRSPVRAKSKASTSERIRLADLKERLTEQNDETVSNNSQSSRFRGYKPGSQPK
jgi:hypothetical protein